MNGPEPITFSISSTVFASQFVAMQLFAADTITTRQNNDNRKRNNDNDEDNNDEDNHNNNDQNNHNPNLVSETSRFRAIFPLVDE